MNSFKVMKFSEVELLGNWKLDWSTHGYARYKPRENAIIKIILENGDVKE